MNIFIFKIIFVKICKNHKNAALNCALNFGGS